MLRIRTSFLTVTAAAAFVFSAPAAAQNETLPPLPELQPVGTTPAPMTQAEVNALPAEYQSLPVETETSETFTGVDGVETITRTRRITAATAVPAQAALPAQAAAPYAQYTYYQTAYAAPAYPAAGYAPMVLDEENWIAECERRTAGRSDKEKGGIIGGLLGAIGGGIAGHELAAAGEALGGTLIGVGVGGIAGILLGNLIAGDGDEDDYDCEGVLNAYLDQYGKYGARYASRAIPAPAPVAYAPQPAYPAYGYAYNQAPAYYPPQQTVVLVPVTTYQQQRVVVREEVREELVPGAARIIPPAPAPQPVPTPVPTPKMIKTAPAPVYVPQASEKMIKD
ncbi:MAG: hypothetical protein AAFQ13_04195 [Pseudomonadota bacterium]